MPRFGGGYKRRNLARGVDFMWRTIALVEAICEPGNNLDLQIISNYSETPVPINPYQALGSGQKLDYITISIC